MEICLVDEVWQGTLRYQVAISNTTHVIAVCCCWYYTVSIGGKHQHGNMSQPHTQLEVNCKQELEVNQRQVMSQNAGLRPSKWENYKFHILFPLKIQLNKLCHKPLQFFLFYLTLVAKWLHKQKLHYFIHAWTKKRKDTLYLLFIYH